MTLYRDKNYTRKPRNPQKPSNYQKPRDSQKPNDSQANNLTTIGNIAFIASFVVAVIIFFAYALTYSYFFKMPELVFIALCFMTLAIFIGFVCKVLFNTLAEYYEGFKEANFYLRKMNRGE